MTKSRKLLAAAISLAATCLLGLFLWWKLGGEETLTAPPPAKSARAAAPRRSPPARADQSAAPAAPAKPQITMEDDPVGSLLLEGQVLDSSDDPVAGATVRLSSNPPRTATSAGDGSFSFDKLVPRTYALSARLGDQAGGPVLHALRAASDPVIIRLAAGASIEVTVVAAEDGVPIAGQLAGFASVAGVVTAGAQPVQAQIIATTPAATRQNVVVTSGADGRYQIERLAAGDYKLTAIVGGGLGGAMGSRRARVEAGQRAQVDIDVPLGDITLLVTVTPKGGAIDAAQVFLFSGAVAARTGKEVSDAVLAAGAEGGVKHQLGPASAPFRFADMKAGAYSVCVVPINGDLQDPAFAQKLQQNVDKLRVYCEPTQLPESPKQQSYTASVPPMAPLE